MKRTLALLLAASLYLSPLTSSPSSAGDDLSQKDDSQKKNSRTLALPSSPSPSSSSSLSFPSGQSPVAPVVASYAPLYEEYDMRVLLGIFGLNGSKKTSFSYTSLTDSIHTGILKEYGIVRGTTEISFSKLWWNYYENLDMVSVINKDGQPLKTITLWRNEKGKRPITSPAELDVIAAYGLHHAPRDSITTIVYERFIPFKDTIANNFTNSLTNSWGVQLVILDGSKVLNPPSLNKTQKLPPGTKDMLSYALGVMQHPDQGKHDALIHFYCRTSTIHVEVERRPDSSYQFRATIPHLMLDEIKSISFDFFTGNAPYCVVGDIKGYPSVKATGTNDTNRKPL